eukprot:TRINITY_DN3130_c4_g1_i1.p1 TRINITY_DN3130_c4_g1~~TRINITY_DN3130_c4_g1_i1.p1  ORF type:complete len:107 (-),score=14.50 TRINITY_DN3130_c4_g1_i1:45-317(-)
MLVSTMGEEWCRVPLGNQKQRRNALKQNQKEKTPPFFLHKYLACLVLLPFPLMQPSLGLTFSFSSFLSPSPPLFLPTTKGKTIFFLFLCA